MAQYRNTGLNATGVLVYTGACKVKKISVRPGADAAPELKVQVFDALAPTVGTTDPQDVARVRAGDSARNREWEKYIYAGSRGGKHYSTGLFVAATTTAAGSTTPTSGQEPEVIVDYEPLS